MLLFSKILLIAASCLDVHSSVGLREMNPMARDQRGMFSLRRGVSLKGALVGGLLALEVKLGRDWAIALNLGVAAPTLGYAVNNYRLR